MEKVKAKPFLKWVGGKTQLLQKFQDYYPHELKKGKLTKYVEPFIGGGAVFFDIVQKYNFEYTYISDINKDLILSYKTIQKNSELLLEFLEYYQKEHDKRSLEEQKEFFNTIKDQFNKERLDINYNRISKKTTKRTAQLIYLNKTCYNGLFRLNSKGIFNVPFGSNKKPKIFDKNNILKIAKLLENTEIKNANYQECLKVVDKNTFVYFDPPYRPISKTALFNSYAGMTFKDSEQVRLAKFFHNLDLKEAKLMLSNSDPQNVNPYDKFFEDLYYNFFIRKVSANRLINTSREKRGAINELLITNYNPEFNFESFYQDNKYAFVYF